MTFEKGIFKYQCMTPVNFENTEVIINDEKNIIMVINSSFKDELWACCNMRQKICLKLKSHDESAFNL